MANEVRQLGEYVEVVTEVNGVSESRLFTKAEATESIINSHLTQRGKANLDVAELAEVNRIKAKVK